MAETQVLRAGRNVRCYLSCPIFNLTLNPSLKLPLITSLTEIFIVLGDSVLPYRIAFWITFCSWKVLLVSFSKGSRNLTFYNFHQWLQFCTGKLHGTKTNKQKNLQAEQPSPLHSIPHLVICSRGLWSEDISPKGSVLHVTAYNCPRGAHTFQVD